MNFEGRKRIMTEIIKAAFDGLVAAGYSVAVDYENGSDPDGKPTRNWEEFQARLFACDEEHMIAFEGKETRMGEGIGWVYLVYGNEPDTVISDYTTNLEAALVKANEVADSWS